MADEQTTEDYIYTATIRFGSGMSKKIEDVLSFTIQNERLYVILSKNNRVPERPNVTVIDMLNPNLAYVDFIPMGVAELA